MSFERICKKHIWAGPVTVVSIQVCWLEEMRPLWAASTPSWVTVDWAKKSPNPNGTISLEWENVYYLECGKTRGVGYTK